MKSKFENCVGGGGGGGGCMDFSPLNSGISLSIFDHNNLLYSMEMDRKRYDIAFQYSNSITGN